MKEIKENIAKDVVILCERYDKDEFAKGVIKLLQDEKLNKEIRKNAKEFLQNKYSLTKRQEEFENEIQKLYRKKSINHIGEL